MKWGEIYILNILSGPAVLIAIIVLQSALLVDSSLTSLISSTESCKVEAAGRTNENIASVHQHPTDDDAYLVGTNGELRLISDGSDEILANQGTDLNGNPAP